MHQRHEWRLFVSSSPRDQRADSLRSIDLVRTHGNKVDAGIAKEFQVLPKALCRIGVKKRRVIGECQRDLPDWLPCTGLIVGCHDGHEQRIGSHRCD